jgi:hypothetical protein
VEGWLSGLVEFPNGGLGQMTASGAPAPLAAGGVTGGEELLIDGVECIRQHKGMLALTGRDYRKADLVD